MTDKPRRPKEFLAELERDFHLQLSGSRLDEIEVRLGKFVAEHIGNARWIWYSLPGPTTLTLPASEATINSPEAADATE